MATIYICKCGRQVRKSTNADNTGNRDTAGCRGCPYLLPWGPTQWDATRHAMVTDVKGYECRMSPSLDYATYYQGGGEDKCVLHIYSLDYDFLDRVTAWAAKQFPDKEISCSFDRSKIRATEFIGGLYGMSVYPMQNKKGMAAKAALIERFFGPDGHRLDKTPEEEKAIVLASIEAGKAKVKTQERKKTMDYIISKHEATGRLYAYYKGSFWFWDSHIQRWLLSQFAEDLYQEERPKRWNFEREHFLAQTSDFHQLDDYEVPSRCIEALLQCNPKTAKTAEKENPTSSAAATAAAEETAATPEPSDSASMTAAPVAKTSEPAGVAPENIFAGADGSTAFDYSGLDDQTVADLHLAEREYSSGKKMAEMGLRRMADAVAIAHGAVVAICENGKDGKFSTHEDTFLRWCASVGLKKDSAYRMLQVSKLMDDSSPREQKVLEELSPSLLYAAAKPSAPAELVQAVKDGDITTHKQFKELEAQLKAEREAREKAEQDVEYFKKDSEDARKAAHAYHCKYDEANAQRNALLDEQGTYVSQITAAEQRAEKAELRAQTAEEDAAEKDKRIRELETIRPQTIEATVVERIRMPEMAEEDAAELTINLAASVTTVQRSFFMAAAAMAPQVKARCANTLWDTVNELATLLAASANPSYEEEEATPFD